MHRLFIGIRPPPFVRARLLDIMHGVEGARWQDDGQLHLTLRFVGEIDARRAEDLASALRTIESAPFPLAIRGVGHFERKGRPTTLWAGLEPSEPLAVLHRRVERACRAAGLEPETRRFAPHITLARLNAGTGPIHGWLADHAQLSSEPWDVAAFMLFESHRGGEGAIYEPVGRYALR